MTTAKPSKINPAALLGISASGDNAGQNRTGAQSKQQPDTSALSDKTSATKESPPSLSDPQSALGSDSESGPKSGKASSQDEAEIGHASQTAVTQNHKGDLQERALVRRLRKQDERAFQELVTLYQDRVFSLTYRMLGNRQEAEDIAQEVFLSVYRAIGRYRGDSKLYTWIYRIALNACKNRLKYLQGRKYHQRVELDENRGAGPSQPSSAPQVGLHSQVPGPEAMAIGNRLQRAIARELANLDPDHRQLIVLRDIQGLSYVDIQNITGLQAGTVKSRLHRARVALKARLQNELGGEQ